MPFTVYKRDTGVTPGAGYIATIYKEGKFLLFNSAMIPVLQDKTMARLFFDKEAFKLAAEFLDEADVKHGNIDTIELMKITKKHSVSLTGFIKAFDLNAEELQGRYRLHEENGLWIINLRQKL
jgi:hypothetical protein